MLMIYEKLIEYVTDCLSVQKKGYSTFRGNTVAFSLFLASVGDSNPAGQSTNLT